MKEINTLTKEEAWVTMFIIIWQSDSVTISVRSLVRYKIGKLII